MQLTSSDTELDVTVTFTGAGLPWTHPLVAHCAALVRAWFADVGMVDFLFQESVTPGIWKYEFTHADGRKWKQKIDFNTVPVTDPLMDFGGDFMRLSEFAAHREIRADVVRLKNEHELTYVHAVRQ